MLRLHRPQLLAALVWLLGLLAVVLQALALCTRYFQPWLSADYIYPQLFAEDLLGGPYPLSGWTMSSAPYFFPDMLVAGALRQFGGSGTVLPAYVAFSYAALALLLGWSWQRATRTGWAAWLGGVAFVNGLLGWQGVGGHAEYLWLLGTAGFHGGAILLGLANFALWAGSTETGLTLRQRGVAVLVLFGGAISDTLFLTQAALPLGIGLWAQAGWDWRRIRVRSYLTALLTALAAVLFVRTVLYFAGWFNFSSVVRLVPSFVAIGQSTQGFLHALFAAIAPQAWGFLLLAGISLGVAFILWRRAGRQSESALADQKPAMGFVLFGLIATTALPLLSAYWKDATHVRYLLPWLVWPGWLAGVWLLAKLKSWTDDLRCTVTLGLVWITLLVALLPQIRVSALGWPYTAQQAQLDEFLVRHNLRYGYSDYWHAHTINTLAHIPVQLFPLRPAGNASFWNNNAFRFYRNEPAALPLTAPEYSFIITDGLDETALRRRFGEPAVQEKVGEHTLWLYSAAEAPRLTQMVQFEVREFLRGRPGSERIGETP